eukprot:scaffold1562_cov323-Prasinococcus_capsulatus_cf.AAC.7
MSGEASVVLATAGYDHTVRFWDALNGVCYRTIPYPDSQVRIRRARAVERRQLPPLDAPCGALLHVHAGASPPRAAGEQAGDRAEQGVPRGGGQPAHQAAHTSNVTAIGFNAEGKWMFSGATPARHSSSSCSLSLSLSLSPRIIFPRPSPAASACVGWLAGARGRERHEADVGGAARRGRVRGRHRQAVGPAPAAGAGVPGGVHLHLGHQHRRAAPQPGARRCSRVALAGWLVRGSNARSLGGADAAAGAGAVAQIAAGNNTGTCYVWRLQKSVKSYDPALDPSGEPAPVTTFEPFHRLNAHSGHYLLKCLISPDVRLLATTSSDKTVGRAASRASAPTRPPPPTHPGGVGRGAGAGEDMVARRLSSGAGAARARAVGVGLRLLRGRGVPGRRFRLMRDRKQAPRRSRRCSVTLRARGDWQVTASSDCSARLWNMTNGKSIIQYAGHTKACVCCALNDCNV